MSHLTLRFLQVTQDRGLRRGPDGAVVCVFCEGGEWEFWLFAWFDSGEVAS